MIALSKSLLVIIFLFFSVLAAADRDFSMKISAAPMGMPTADLTNAPG